MMLSAMEQELMSCADRFKMLQEQQLLTLRDPPSLGADEQCSQDSRQQLNEERQNVRRNTLQLEVETKELHNSIDN